MDDNRKNYLFTYCEKPEVLTTKNAHLAVDLLM